MSDNGAEFSRSIGWAAGDRTGRYAIVVDHGKVVYAEADTQRGSIEHSGAEGVLAKL
jgi:alkyl hydroperoxide reductase 1